MLLLDVRGLTELPLPLLSLLVRLSSDAEVGREEGRFEARDAVSAAVLAVALVLGALAVLVARDRTREGAGGADTSRTAAAAGGVTVVRVDEVPEANRPSISAASKAAAAAAAAACSSFFLFVEPGGRPRGFLAGGGATSTSTSPEETSPAPAKLHGAVFALLEPRVARR